MENQTAVDWLKSELHRQDMFDGFAWEDRNYFMKLLDQAKAMEKDQKRLDYIAGHDLCRCVTDNTDEAKECFEEYYNLWKN